MTTTRRPLALRLLALSSLALSITACSDDYAHPAARPDREGPLAAGASLDAGAPPARASRGVASLGGFGDVAPVIELGARRFIALGSAEEAELDDPPSAVEAVSLATYRTAVSAELPEELAAPFERWSRGTVRVFERGGESCELATGAPHIISVDESPAEELDLECEGPYDACLERALLLEPTEALWARGGKSFAVELLELGACETPVVAAVGDARSAPQPPATLVAAHMDARLLPDAWTEAVTDHPAFRENQRRYAAELAALGVELGEDSRWVEPDELAAAFRFESDDFAHLLVHFEPACGADREPLSLLLRQPLDGGEPSLVDLGPAFSPNEARDLIIRDGALSFVGWIDDERFGVIGADGRASAAYTTRRSDCGC